MRSMKKKAIDLYKQLLTCAEGKSLYLERICKRDDYRGRNA